MYWNPFSVILILLVTTVNYFGGIYINKSNQDHHKKIILVLAIIATLSILIYFKYANFLILLIDKIFSLGGKAEFISPFEIILPIGISFFTLQAIAYSIDVYRGNIKPELNFLKFSLFISYFPQLLAGPIERAGRLIPQLNFQNKVTLEQGFIGLKRVLWGLFKKIIIADNLAILVNQIYGSYETSSGGILLLATYMYAFQIYCDFSGYVDIAIGVSKIFGINLTENFNKPYMAVSIKDFWHRWHITLSSWFRDYLYIPLGGKKLSMAKWGTTILLVFIISGFWHGANYTFIVWGLLHGVFYLLNHGTSLVSTKLKTKVHLQRFNIPRFVKIIVVFNLVSFAWIFFRADSLQHGLIISSKVLSLPVLLGTDLNFLSSIDSIKNLGTENMFLIMNVILFLTIEFSKRLDSYINRINYKRKIWSEILLTDYLLIILVVFATNMGRQFIYFQF